MKILTKEEEDAHYTAVLKGGAIGGAVGLVGGLAAVWAASRRYATIRELTVPMKAFLVSSSGTFCGIVAGDNASRRFEIQRNADQTWLEEREEQEERLRQERLAKMSWSERLYTRAHEEKYKIITASWVLSILGSFALVNRNPYLTGQQKLVQARVYAQGLTLAVVCASAAFEIHDQRKGQGILDAARKKGIEIVPERHERYQGEDLWKDMIAAEEQRLKLRQEKLRGEEKKKSEKKEEDEEEEKKEEKKE